jgi:hypothetical protein
LRSRVFDPVRYLFRGRAHRHCLLSALNDIFASLCASVADLSDLQYSS